jgi:hypothetical protein
MHLLRKIEQAKALLFEIEALVLGDLIPTQNPARAGYLVDAKEVLRLYPRDAGLVRWATCARVCDEMGIEPTRGNCSSVGSTLKGAGFPRRRSQGKVLYNLPSAPPMREIF